MLQWNRAILPQTAIRHNSKASITTTPPTTNDNEKEKKRKRKRENKG